MVFMGIGSILSLRSGLPPRRSPVGLQFDPRGQQPGLLRFHFQPRGFPAPILKPKLWCLMAVFTVP